MKKAVFDEIKAVKAAEIVLNYCKKNSCDHCVFKNYETKKCNIGCPDFGWGIEKTIDDYREE